ncbi:three-helix bundle dimerization domain-containing protein [Saccharopolyspora sp. 5N102]|uniref:three-helix bundle dimerization domain-containing protein n=1 Tax=Saccharopolyspora sp. 5N102 TaxID=3375155 RepID=UPI0037A7F8D3
MTTADTRATSRDDRVRPTTKGLHARPAMLRPVHLLATDQALDRCIDTLAARFPRLHRDTIARCVQGAYNELRATATIIDHLVPLAQRHAAEQLATLPPDRIDV